MLFYIYSIISSLLSSKKYFEKTTQKFQLIEEALFTLFKKKGCMGHIPGISTQSYLFGLDTMEKTF